MRAVLAYLLFYNMINEMNYNVTIGLAQKSRGKLGLQAFTTSSSSGLRSSA